MSGDCVSKFTFGAQGRDGLQLAFHEVRMFAAAAGDLQFPRQIM